MLYEVITDIPKDVSAQKVRFEPEQSVDLRGYHPTVVPNRLQLDKLVAAIRNNFV